MRRRAHRHAWPWMFVLIVAAGIVFVSQTLAFASFPGQKAWAQRYDGLAAGQDGAYEVQANPIENLVYVTGYTARATYDYSTIAYDAVTGAKKWSKSYDGPGKGTDAAVALAVSPDGTRVFVTGLSLGTANVDFATVSYDAVTGDPKWTARYDGGGGDDHATAIALSPDGSVVYVTGDSRGSANRDIATVAYDAATGAQIPGDPIRLGERPRSPCRHRGESGRLAGLRDRFR